MSVQAWCEQPECIEKASFVAARTGQGEGERFCCTCFRDAFVRVTLWGAQQVTVRGMRPLPQYRTWGKPEQRLVVWEGEDDTLAA